MDVMATPKALLRDVLLRGAGLKQPAGLKQAWVRRVHLWQRMSKGTVISLEAGCMQAGEDFSGVARSLCTLFSAACVLMPIPGASSSARRQMCTVIKLGGALGLACKERGRVKVNRRKGGGHDVLCSTHPLPTECLPVNASVVCLWLPFRFVLRGAVMRCWV